MTPPLENTTSVQIAFYKADNTLTQNVSANLVDNRNSFDVLITVADRTKFDSATVYVDKRSASGEDTLKSFTTPVLREMRISTNGQYSYAFEDKVVYSISMEVKYKENGSSKRYLAKFSWGTDQNDQDLDKYPFLYRENGGETLGESSVVNKNEIENGSNIVLNVPLQFNDNPEVDGQRVDEDVPCEVTFTFEEKDIAPGDINTEPTDPYLPEALSYEVDGEYTLPTNGLHNDRAYVVTATAYYADGKVLSRTLDEAVYVIKPPVISSVTAYGLDSEALYGEDKTGTGVSGISNVMEVYLENDGIPVVITPVDNEITFYLSQEVDGALVKMYSATKTVSDHVVTGGLLRYSITKPIPNEEPADDQLVQLWTDAPPQGNVFVVTAEIVYEPEGNTITKVSNSKIETFNNDIIPLPSVSLKNAWIAASVTTVDGQRMVNNDDTLSMQGYADAPALAIAGQFSKTAFFGSGQQDGPFKDLDLVGNTKFKFEMKVNDGDWEPVQALHLILGSNGASDQQNYVALMTAPMQNNVDGLYNNVPGDAGVSGPLQPNAYFMVCGPPQNAYQQGDEVKVMVQIVTTGEESTWPAPTESNSQVVVHKVKTYSMTIGESSEPTFTGSGVTGTLEVPINNPTELTNTNDYYLTSVSFKSDDLTTSLVTENIMGDGADPDNVDGIFNLTVVNPSKRGVGAANEFTYRIYYKIDDPNGSSIKGPDSEPYTINVADEPTNENFTVTDYSYTTFHNEGNPNGKSSFQFDISFQDGVTTSIDGAMVYFVSDNDDSDSSNNISETLVKYIPRSSYANPIQVTLQMTHPTTSSITDGIYVLDISGNPTSQKWLNCRSGTIVVRPYKTPKIFSDNDEPVIATGYDDESIINNMPVIDTVDPDTVTLTGGVIESYNATQMDWQNDIPTKYPNVSSYLTVSHQLQRIRYEGGIEQTNDDRSGDIMISGENASYYINTADYDPSTFEISLRIKVEALSDNSVYYSQPVTLEFPSISVDTDGMEVAVNRGSNDQVVKASMANYTVTGDDSKLNVTSIELVDNSSASNGDPNGEGVTALQCTSSDSDVQPIETVNTYALSSGDGYQYSLSDVVMMVARVEAGVNYTVNGENRESTPLYLTLSNTANASNADATFQYRVAKKPSVILHPHYQIVPSGVDQGKIKLVITINANGLAIEGIQGVTIFLSQDGDHTNPNSISEGGLAILEFDSSQVTNSYTIEDDALRNVTSDNLAVGETPTLIDENGFEYKLTVGSLDSNDTSEILIPVGAGYDSTQPIKVGVVCGTRLGQGCDVDVVTPTP